MRTIHNKSEAEPAFSKPGNAKPPDIASRSVPDTLAAVHANPETGLARTEVGARHTAIRAVAVAGFAMAVTAVIERLLGLVAVGWR
jgi:hypothetical protein